MATIANLLIGLGVDFGGVSKGLNRGAKNLRGGIGNLRASLGGMQGILDTMAGTAARIGALMVDAAADFVRMGIELATKAEQTQISFEVMLGSAEQAAKLIEQINQFAAATPFESTELVDASKQLLAFGTEADQIIPTLRALGDLAAGTGQPITELATIFGKARVQGRLMMEDINQLTERNINVLSVWSEKLGQPVSEIREMVSAGKFGFRDLQEALIELTGAGSRFGGMMERQSHTVAGLWSTAVDGAKTAAMGFGAALLDWLDIRDALGGLGAAFTAIKDSLGGLQSATQENKLTAEGWADGWLTAAEFVTRGIAHVIDFFKFLGDVWGFVVSGFKAGVSVLLDGLALVLEGAEAAAAKLPAALGGTANADFGSNSMRATAAAFAHEATQAWDETIKSLSERTNAEAVTSFFEGVRQQLKQTTAAAQATEQAIQLVESAAGAGAGGKGSLLAMQRRVELAKQLTRIERDQAIEAATRGSTEAFSAIRQFRGQGRNDPLRQLEKLNEAAAREQELQRENNRLIREALNNLQAAEVLN